MTILKQPSENPTVTLAVNSHIPTNLWKFGTIIIDSNVCPAVFFLGGKGKGIPVKKSLEGWVDGWKVLGCCCREPRHGKPQASKDWNPWRSLRLGVNVDDGIGGGQGGFADDS